MCSRYRYKQCQCFDFSQTHCTDNTSLWQKRNMCQEILPAHNKEWETYLWRCHRHLERKESLGIILSSLVDDVAVGLNGYFLFGFGKSAWIHGLRFRASIILGAKNPCMRDAQTLSYSQRNVKSCLHFFLQHSTSFRRPDLQVLTQNMCGRLCVSRSDRHIHE